jgi:hypothetical protein
MIGAARTSLAIADKAIGDKAIVGKAIALARAAAERSGPVPVIDPVGARERHNYRPAVEEEIDQAVAVPRTDHRPARAVAVREHGRVVVPAQANLPHDQPVETRLEIAPLPRGLLLHAAARMAAAEAEITLAPAAIGVARAWAAVATVVVVDTAAVAVEEADSVAAVVEEEVVAAEDAAVEAADAGDNQREEEQHNEIKNHHKDFLENIDRRLHDR